VELTRRLREIAQKVEFLEAGAAKEKIEAAAVGVGDRPDVCAVGAEKRCAGSSSTGRRRLELPPAAIHTVV